VDGVNPHLREDKYYFVRFLELFPRMECIAFIPVISRWLHIMILTESDAWKSGRIDMPFFRQKHSHQINFSGHPNNVCNIVMVLLLSVSKLFSVIEIICECRNLSW
jgi:hypothetical protein